MRKPELPPNIHDIYLDDGFLEALKNPAYAEIARKIERRYWHWDRVRFVARANKLDPNPAWAIVKIGRSQHYRHTSLWGQGMNAVRYMLPNAAQQELMLIDQELAGRVSFDEERPLSKPMREKFILSALQEEAIASSMLEGAVTTRQEAKQMLKSGRKPRTPGEQMVANNYRTIQFIRESSALDLSPEYLLEIQKLLTVGTLENPLHVGRFRTEDDHVNVVDDRDGEVMHVPPPAAELPDRLRRLCDFANARMSAHSFIHPVIKAILLHFQIGYDHPFCDGNGRTARAIFYWYLLRTGYWLFEFLPISPMFLKSPGKYARAYLHTETDDFDATYFIMYNLSIVSRGREKLREYVARKQSQLLQAHKAFRSDPMLNHRQQEVLLKVARNPDMMLTIAVHQNSNGIAYGTARSDLFDLAARGYLKQEMVRNRYVFIQGKKLEDLDFDDDPPKPHAQFPLPLG